VLLVRQALRGLADTVRLDAVELNDISTAVSEACNNVVTHAYPDGEGAMDVELLASGEGLEVVVRDHGCGLTPQPPEPASEIGGIGLPVMAALAQSVEFASLDSGGTEVRMRFAVPKVATLEDQEETVWPGATPTSHGDPDDTVALTVGPPQLASAVVQRVLTALAARARFSTERISDTQRLAAELVTYIGDPTRGARRLTVGVSVAPRTLDLTVGPLRNGSSLDPLAATLDRFTDDHEVSRAGSAEMLALRLSEPVARGNPK
jgi:anti-sigma regulatory factor (Ser/Thr protein kinase)